MAVIVGSISVLAALFSAALKKDLDAAKQFVHYGLRSVFKGNSVSGGSASNFSISCIRQDLRLGLRMDFSVMSHS